VFASCDGGAGGAGGHGGHGGGGAGGISVGIMRSGDAPVLVDSTITTGQGGEGGLGGDGSGSDDDGLEGAAYDVWPPTE
jgi:hypothetical protein